MTDILDLEGWNVIAKHIDGDDYLIESEYTVPPKACTKCGNIGNLYKHGPKPITIRDSQIAKLKGKKYQFHQHRCIADTHRTAGVCDDFHLSRLVTVAGITTPAP